MQLTVRAVNQLTPSVKFHVQKLRIVRVFEGLLALTEQNTRSVTTYTRARH